MMHKLTLLLLRLWYGYEMTLAYLAGNMGDGLAMANHESMAEEVSRKYHTELIN